MDPDGVGTRVVGAVGRVRVTGERDESALGQPGVAAREIIVGDEPGLSGKVGGEAVAPARWPVVDDAGPPGRVQVGVLQGLLGSVTVEVAGSDPDRGTEVADVLGVVGMAVLVSFVLAVELAVNRDQLGAVVEHRIIVNQESGVFLLRRRVLR